MPASPERQKRTVVRVLPELDFGGVESRIGIQSRLYDKDAYRLRVCAFHKRGKAYAAVRDLGIPVDVLDVSPSARNPVAPLALAQYLRQVRPDVLHASIVEANVHALVASRLVHVPVVIAEETGMPSHGFMARNLLRLGYRSVSAVVGVTQAVCDYILEVDHAPPDRVRLIYNCANPQYFPEARQPTGRATGGKMRVLLVARLQPVKNHLLFLEALAPVLAEFPNVEVSIAGDGPLKDATVRKIAELHLGERVTLLGFRSDVRPLLEQAHVYAIPSENEGCSISLIEAMASGVHAIGSAVPGIKEVLGPELAPEQTAPPSSRAAWTALLRKTFSLTEPERAALGARAQQRAYEYFSPVAYVGRVESMYRELLAKHSTSW